MQLIIYVILWTIVWNGAIRLIMKIIMSLWKISQTNNRNEVTKILKYI